MEQNKKRRNTYIIQTEYASAWYDNYYKEYGNYMHTMAEVNKEWKKYKKSSYSHRLVKVMEESENK